MKYSSKMIRKKMNEKKNTKQIAVINKKPRVAYGSIIIVGEHARAHNKTNANTCIANAFVYL